MHDSERARSGLFSELRARAAAIVRARGAARDPDGEPSSDGDLSRDEALRLVEDLRVHQIELELQNEQLQRAQIAAQAARDQYVRLFEFSPYGFIITDQLAVVKKLNQMACVLLGQAKRSIEGVPLRQLICPADQDTFLRTFAAVRAGSARELVDVTVVRHDQVRLPVRFELTPGPADGADAADRSEFWCALIDIRKQRQAEEELRKSEQKFRAIATYANDWETWFGPRGEPIWINPAVEQLTGLAPERCLEIANFPLPVILPIDRPAVAVALRDAAAGGRGNNLEFRILHTSGMTRWGAMSWQPMRDECGRNAGFRTSVRDISDLKAVEAALVAEKERANAANQAKSQFLANMSHELRTPLNSILGFSEILRDAGIGQELAEFADIINVAGNNLLAIVNSILDIARIEAGKIKIRPEPLRLAKEIELTSAIFLATARKKGIDFVLSLDDHLPPMIVADFSLIRQIIVNLVGNAIKFTDHGRVTLEVALKEIAKDQACCKLLFTVADTGCGIIEEDQTRIFNAFEQSECVLTRRHGGTGLGLTISRELVTLLGGEIWVTSEFGVGSWFSFWIPVGLVGAPPPPAPGIARPGAPDRAVGRLLVVDDDDVARQFYREFLERRGYRIELCPDGECALDVLNRRPFDAVVMDIRLPKLNGLDATRQIRSGAVANCDPKIPILAVTAQAMHGDRERFLSAGFDLYLSKPIRRDELYAALDRLLAAAPPPESA